MRYVDNYDRADGPVGADWLELGSNGAYVISNGRLVMTSTNSTVRYLRYAKAMSGPNHKVGQIMTRNNSGSHGLVVRSNADMTRHYGIRSTSSVTQMFRVSGGTTLFGPTGGAWPSNALVELGIEGSTLSYWLNGELRWSVDDTTIPDGNYVGNRWQGSTTPPYADEFYAQDASKTSDWVSWYDGTTETPAMLDGIWNGTSIVKATFDRNSS